MVITSHSIFMTKFIQEHMVSQVFNSLSLDSSQFVFYASVLVRTMASGVKFFRCLPVCPSHSHERDNSGRP